MKGTELIWYSMRVYFKRNCVFIEVSLVYIMGVIFSFLQRDNNFQVSSCRMRFHLTLNAHSGLDSNILEGKFSDFRNSIIVPSVDFEPKEKVIPPPSTCLQSTQHRECFCGKFFGLGLDSKVSLVYCGILAWIGTTFGMTFRNWFRMEYNMMIRVFQGSAEMTNSWLFCREDRRVLAKRTSELYSYYRPLNTCTHPCSELMNLQSTFHSF